MLRQSGQIVPTSTDRHLCEVKRDQCVQQILSGTSLPLVAFYAQPDSLPVGLVIEGLCPQGEAALCAGLLFGIVGLEAFVTFVTRPDKRNWTSHL